MRLMEEEKLKERCESLVLAQKSSEKAALAEQLDITL